MNKLFSANVICLFLNSVQKQQSSSFTKATLFKRLEWKVHFAWNHTKTLKFFACRCSYLLERSLCTLANVNRLKHGINSLEILTHATLRLLRPLETSLIFNCFSMKILNTENVWHVKNKFANPPHVPCLKKWFKIPFSFHRYPH